MTFLKKTCLVQQQKERKKKHPAAFHPIKTGVKKQEKNVLDIKIYPAIDPSLTLGKNPWV